MAKTRRRSPRPDHVEDAAPLKGYEPPAPEPLPMMAEGTTTDMTGGPPQRRRPSGKPVGESGRTFVGIKLELPLHEHEQLRSNSHTDRTSMTKLARECIRIGLVVKSAQRNGDEVAIMGKNGKRKSTLV